MKKIYNTLFIFLMAVVFVLEAAGNSKYEENRAEQIFKNNTKILNSAKFLEEEAETAEQMISEAVQVIRAMEETETENPEMQEVPEEDDVYWEWDAAGIEDLKEDLTDISKDIKYPHLREPFVYNDDDEKRLHQIYKINKLLEEDVIEKFEGEFNSCELDYEITYFDKDYISVLYKGWFYHSSTMHPYDMIWGVTIDMRTGKLVPIQDVIEWSVLKDKLEQKDFVQVYGTDNDIDWYKKFEIAGIYGDEKYYNEFYLKEDKIGIILHTYDGMIVELDR